MNITRVNIFPMTNISYSKQPLNKNKVSSMPAACGMTSAQSLAFGAARKTETRRASGIYRRIPVDRKKLETINKTLNAYKETLPAAEKTFNNYANIYENSKNEAAEAFETSSPKCDEEGNYRCAKGTNITSDICSVSKAFTYNIYNDTLNSYKEGFINSTSPLPDGIREIKKGVILNPGDTEGEYFEGRIYDTSSFKKGANNLNTTEKIIAFDSETNGMLKYSENVLGDDDKGFSRDFAAKTLTFNDDGTPLSYREKAEYHERDDYDSAKKVIIFAKDDEGNTVPKYYYEDWRCLNKQNRVTYSYKAERLSDGSWIVKR